MDNAVSQLLVSTIIANQDECYLPQPMGRTRGRQQWAWSWQGWEDDAQFGDGVGEVDPHMIEAIAYVKLNEVDGAIAGVGIEE